MPTRFLWYVLWKQQPFRELWERDDIQPGKPLWDEYAGGRGIWQVGFRWSVNRDATPRLLTIPVRFLGDQGLLVALFDANSAPERFTVWAGRAPDLFHGRRLIFRTLEEYGPARSDAFK